MRRLLPWRARLAASSGRKVRTTHSRDRSSIIASPVAARRIGRAAAERTAEPDRRTDVALQASTRLNDAGRSWAACSHVLKSARGPRWNACGFGHSRSVPSTIVWCEREPAVVVSSSSTPRRAGAVRNRQHDEIILIRGARTRVVHRVGDSVRVATREAAITPFTGSVVALNESSPAIAVHLDAREFIRVGAATSGPAATPPPCAPPPPY